MLISHDNATTFHFAKQIHFRICIQFRYLSSVESLTCTYGENDHSAAPCAALLEIVVTSQYHSSRSKQVPQFCFKIRLLLKNSFLVTAKNPAETEALENKLEWIFV